MRCSHTIIAIYLTYLSSNPTRIRLTYSHLAPVKHCHLPKKWLFQLNIINASSSMVMLSMRLYKPLLHCLLAKFNQAYVRAADCITKSLLGKTTSKHFLKQIAKSWIKRRNCSVERSDEQKINSLFRVETLNVICDITGIQRF